MQENNKPDYFGNTLIFFILILLLYAGYLSYRSIDWNVLKRLEDQPLVLPTPIPPTTATPSAIKK